VAKQNQQRTAPAPAHRAPGKPHPEQRVGTPENIERIRIWWCEGRSLYWIAKQLGCDRSTVQYHLGASIIPKQRTIWESRIEEIVLKVEHLYTVAWAQFQKSQKPQTMEQIKRTLAKEGVDGDVVERVSRATTRTGEACWLDYVRWCLDWFSKVSGIYAAEKISLETDFRVAGKTRQEIDEEALKYLAERVAERKRHEAMVCERYGAQVAKQ
jgi:hypothetical protein